MNKKAFTLIEILIVILIIGTLTALSVAQYTNSQKKAKIQIFESNINNIVKTLNVYRGNNILSGNQKESYPVSLSDQKFKSLFKQEPINPYTNKSMLSDNSSESGIQYVSDGSSYSMCIVQQDVDDINENGRTDEPLPITLYPACTGTLPSLPGSKYTVSVVATPSNAGTPVASPNKAYTGQKVILSANPNSCYNFSNWSSSDVTISDNSFVMPAKDVTVTANYTIKPPYTVSAAPNNPSYGTVTGSGTYDCGSTATLTAVPTTEFTFTGWYEDGSQVSTATTYVFTVTGNHTLEARFNAIPYTITVNKNPAAGGSPTATPNPAYVGQTVTLAANPDSCYNFSSWSSSDVTISNLLSPTATFAMPAKNVSITANYAIRQYTVSAAPNNTSYGTVTGSGTYDCSSTATLTAVPATGFTFTGWYENGSQVSTATTYVFTVRDNRTLEARFITIAFARNSVAYTSDGAQVAVNQPRFEQGKFGQAIMVEEGTTNKIETEGGGASQDWTKWNHWCYTTNWKIYWYTCEQYDDPVMGKVFRGTAKTDAYLYDYYPYTVTAGSIYTLSIWLKASVQVTGSIIGYMTRSTDNATIGSQSKTITIGTTWQKFEWQITPNESRTTSAGTGIHFVSGWDGIIIEAARPQLEQKPYATSFINGTRSPETLTISTAGVLNPQKGTVECWVYFPQNGRWSVVGQTPTIFWAGSNSTYVMQNQIYADVVDQGTLRLVIYDSNGNYKLIQTTSKITSGWHYLAYEWDNTGPLAIFVDGVKQSTTTAGTGTGICSTVERFTLGFNGYDNARHINSLIDDLRISSIARTDAEIQTLYKNNQPAPKDADTTLKLTFDGNLTP